MAAARRGKSVALIEQLLAEPYRFDFFQAVRILEHWGRCPPPSRRVRYRIGVDHQPEEESIRIRSYVSHRFPASSIQSIKTPTDDSAVPEMTVGFMGTVGPMGALPPHYTQLVIDRVRQKDFALRDFLDMFHHRLISLFHRAWQKYRLPLEYELGAADLGVGKDLFTSAIFCLAGMGTPDLLGRQGVPDNAFLYYSGILSQAPRSCISLERAIQDFFQLPTEIQQFQGSWLYLDPTDQSRLTNSFGRLGNNQLGGNVVVGERVWGVENRFRVRLGPLPLASFQRLMPNGDLLAPVAQFLRSFVGPEFDFDIQPILLAREVPACQLGGGLGGPPQLGWNSWILSQTATCDAGDAVFMHEGYPSQGGAGVATSG